MIQIILAVILILSLPVRVLAQSGADDWLSLDRLSLAVRTSYHLSPWRSYNNALNLVEDAVRYDSYYLQPQGSFERIRGDASIDAVVGYRLFHGLTLEAIGGTTRTGSELSLAYGRLSPTVRLEHHQGMKLSIFHFGAGLRQELQLTENLSLVASLSYQQASATFDFDHRYLSSADRSFGYESTYAAQLKDDAGKIQGQVGLEVAVYGPIKLTTVFDYRHLIFTQLSGDGTYRYRDYNSGYEESQPFHSVLAEAEGYFGIVITVGQHANEYLLYELWRRTSVRPWWQTIKETALDLSGFGLTVGISVGF